MNFEDNTDVCFQNMQVNLYSTAIDISHGLFLKILLTLDQIRLHAILIRKAIAKVSAKTDFCR